MRLEFNILWVEDQKGAVKSQRDRIAQLLRNQGFKLQTEFASSVEEAKGFLANDIYGDHIDLVLMDFDLGSGPKGGVGLTEVRAKFPYKDIVFYSAGGVQTLQKSVSRRKIQGVFCSSRKELPSTVFGVFEALVKKVLDIDHSRGIVMGATSEIDYFVNQALLNAFENGNEELRKAALKIVEQQLVEIRKAFEKEALKVAAATKLLDLLNLHHIYSSAHRLRLLRKILEKQGTHVDERPQMLSYAVDIMPKRNDLAHIRVERQGFSRKIYYRKSNQELKMEDMQKLRVALLDHHETFEKISISLALQSESSDSSVG
jgi:hypothetical protein